MINIDKLDEAVIDENIPRDLAQAYRNATAYASQRHPQSKHNELSATQSRRYTNWDYGKATYDNISKDEAIQMVKQNKSNIEKLRVIFRNSLVEFEVRDNGQIYAIYGSDAPVQIDGKIYKNVRFVTWKKVLENADKIYVTDEYEHPISNDQRQHRDDANRIHSIMHVPAADEVDDYDEHKPYKNMAKTTQLIQELPDTGNHDTYKRLRINYPSSIKDSAILVSSKQQNVRDVLIQLEEDKNRLYKAYTNVRKAYKKLLAERSDFDEEEFDEREEYLHDKQNRILGEYQDIAKQVKIVKAKLIKQIDSQIAVYNEKLASYTHRVEDALTKGYALKKELEDITVRFANSKTNTNEYNSDLRSIFYRIQTLKNEIESAVSRLEDKKAELASLKQRRESGESGLDYQIDNDTEYIQNYLNILNAKFAALDEKQEEAIKIDVSRISEIADELKSVDAELAEIRPHHAAEKARKAAKNREAELDPALANIVQFSDFSA